MQNEDQEIVHETEEVIVEHDNLLRRCRIKKRVIGDITLVGTWTYIDGRFRKLYPTGKPEEPWTTNISHSNL